MIARIHYSALGRDAVKNVCHICSKHPWLKPLMVLLALSDEGTPAHDREHAAALRSIGATVMSVTPEEFPAVLADALL